MHETIFCQKTEVLAATSNLRVEQTLVHLGTFLHFSQKVVGVTLNFTIRNCPQNSERVQFRFQFPKWCIIKHLKDTKLYFTEFLRTEMTSNPQNEAENPSSVFFKCLLKLNRIW